MGNDAQSIRGPRSSTAIKERASADSLDRTANETVRQMIDALEDVYEFRQPAEVRAFLASHPEVLALVIKAAEKIPEFLPVDEPIILEILFDPEEVDDQGELFAVVPTQLDPDEVRPQLDRLLREWLIDAGRRVGLLFNVGVEYR